MTNDVIPGARATASAVLSAHGSVLLRFIDHVVLDAVLADRITGETVVAAARQSATITVSYQVLAATAWVRLSVDPRVARVLTARARSTPASSTTHAAAVGAALRRMPLIDRAIWHLSTRDRLTPTEISAIIGRTESFVRSHITTSTAAIPQPFSR